MWIVRLALRRPFTVAAFCLVVLLLGALSSASMSADIFPAIDIPVVIVVWNYPGMSAEDMESRVTFISERSISTSVSGISRIDSQTIDGTAVLRVYFEQGSDIGSAIAQITSASLSGRASCRQGRNLPSSFSSTPPMHQWLNSLCRGPRPNSSCSTGDSTSFGFAFSRFQAFRPLRPTAVSSAR